jgi:predicted Ser/Thr protein kinase
MDEGAAERASQRGRPLAGGGGYLDKGALLDGRYLIREEIGRGGMSIIYAALDRELDATVAVKLLVPPPAAAQIARERMRREVQAVRGLRHPSIVRVFDVLEDGHWTFIIMELIEGSDLQNLVARRGPLSPDDVTRIGIEIAEALNFAHRHGVLHRDVKPHNLLLDAEGRPFLTDFGSARIEGRSTLTQTGGAIGTLCYMAPEVLNGQRADARSDVFSLGMTLYYALCAKLPNGASPHLPAAPAPDGHHPRDSNPAVPEWLDCVVADSTRSDPSLRYQTAASLAEYLGAPSVEGALAVAHAELRPDRCLVCAQPEPLGLVVCPQCAAGSTSPSDPFVAAVPAANRRLVRERIDVLALLAPSAPIAQLRELALGRKPLLRVPEAHATDVLGELSRRGIEARALTSAQTWDLVPRSLKVLVLGVLACGWLAPVSNGLWLGAVGTLTAAVMIACALRLAGRPLIDPEQSRSTLPGHLESGVVSVLCELAPGPARSLLADIVCLGRNCLSGLEDQPVLTAQVSQLVGVACTAAKELDWLDRSLARLAEQRKRVGDVPQRWIHELGRCERARDGLVQRLLESSAALGLARGTGNGSAEGLEEQLAELTREIEAEVAIQAEAAKEVAEFVDGASFGDALGGEIQRNSG